MNGAARRSIQVSKSATRTWHTCHNVGNVCDQRWDRKAARFWRGVKTRANNDSNAKQPLPIQDWADFVRHRRLARTPVGIRCAARAAFCLACSPYPKDW
eukprot:6066356-Pyramimonas_sp.AAC.1